MLLLVGELINTSRGIIRQAVEARNGVVIQNVARAQAQAGAHYIDVNCGNLGKNEEDAMLWLIAQVQEAVDLPLCIDSPNHKALEAGLAALKTSFPPMINSITLEQKRFSSVLPLALKYKAKIVGLCIDDAGIPKILAKKLEVAKKLIDELVSAGIKHSDIYIDPLINPISIDDQSALQALYFNRQLKEKISQVNVICGLSNISYGLPCRTVLNRCFMVQAMTAGMDAFILDPTDRELMGLFFASMALLGRDRYCSQYLKAYRRSNL